MAYTDMLKEMAKGLKPLKIINRDFKGAKLPVPKRKKDETK